ncbi:MAG: hypothetical protein QXO03_05485 [Thermoplasmatales archaeon]
MSKFTVIASPPDLDSVASVYLLKRAIGNDVDVKYLDHAVIEKSEADYIIDSPNGLARISRFDHHETKEKTCSAMRIVEHFKMGEPERRLAEAVCWQDNAGWKDLNRDGMDNLLDTLLKSFLASGEKTEDIDIFFSRAFDVLLKKFQVDERLSRQADYNILFRSEDGSVIAVNGEFPKDLLFHKYKPRFLVKVSRFGISVTRSALYDTPDLNDFAYLLEKLDRDHFDKWFIHPQGFYIGYSIDPESSEAIPLDPVLLAKNIALFVAEKG